MELYLIDDGTLDTVLECSECGEQLRYFEARRDKHGCVLPSWLMECELEHADECEGPSEEEEA